METAAVETRTSSGREGPRAARTIPELLLERVAATPAATAFLEPQGEEWKPLSWGQLGDRIRAAAAGLQALGLRPGERCALLSGTRLEWIIADLATLSSGGATTTIYPSSTAEDCAFILNDSAAVLVFVENEEQVRKLATRRDDLRTIKQVIVFDGTPSADGWVISLAQLMERGREHDARDPAAFERIARAVRPGDLATLIYTSGTTGRAKGVELLHEGWIYEAEAIDTLGLLRPEDIQYLWLPLAHIFGKVLEVAQLRIGFLTAIDGRVDRLVDNLPQVRPTFIAAVPRIFEKIYNRVVGAAKEAGGLTHAIFKWAFRVGAEVSRLRQAGRAPTGLLALKHAVASRLVFSRLQARFGGRLRFFVSGSAPLSRTIAEFFHAADVLILEGYGLTESSAATCVNLPHRYRFGTVGPPLPGTELKIAEDGEVLIRGRGVMRGYHGLPELTAETLDADGWLHTGDLGELKDGFLSITGRKKDLLKTSQGKYVVPSDLELKLKVSCPMVSQVLVHGNNRHFVSALVAIDPDSVRAWAATRGMRDASYDELVRSPQVFGVVEECVTALNGQLASFESIKRFVILPRDLTVESGDLTPSLKLKRQVVEQKYRALLDELYRDAVAQL
ncbi:MAG TPA: long-chain fatty acid--CoA ligase [Myxococcaceae bacterium]|nr:long-chain fatty acid--CoA ligase [Myxococcaceae bacterium]